MAVTPSQPATSTISQLHSLRGKDGGVAPHDYSDRRIQALKAGINKVTLVGRIGGNYDLGINATPFISGEKFSSVTFDVTPEITESGPVSLMAIDGIRSAAGVTIYMGANSRNFSINATFVSRTVKEATDNYNNLYILKAWRMPAQSKAGAAGGAWISNVEEVLRLYAYDKLINGVPVAMQSQEITYASDTDYIETKDHVAFPIVLKISMGFREVRNLSDLNAFDYQKYKRGTLDSW